MWVSFWLGSVVEKVATIEFSEIFSLKAVLLKEIDVGCWFCCSSSAVRTIVPVSKSYPDAVLVFESHDSQQRFISFREDSGERSLLECRCGFERSISSAFYDCFVNQYRIFGADYERQLRGMLNRMRSISIPVWDRSQIFCRRVSIIRVAHQEIAYPSQKPLFVELEA